MLKITIKGGQDFFTISPGPFIIHFSGIYWAHFPTPCSPLRITESQIRGGRLIRFFQIFAESIQILKTATQIKIRNSEGPKK
ncbi:hypothetical protein BGS_0954 [Beggiatoa sp. SS]|nr:hypothetical protein BGS_0954 [Beggiatoa sp. SS]